jgi:hypothetical protein
MFSTFSENASVVRLGRHSNRTRLAPTRPGLRAAAAGYVGWTFQTYVGGTSVDSYRCAHATPRRIHENCLDST